MLVYIIAVILQFFVTVLKPIKEIKPTFTPMTVSLAGTHHFYNCDRAKKDFGYKPVVTLEEGIVLTCEHFSHLKNKKS